MKKGQTLVEVLIAVAVATIAVVALVQVATRSVGTAGLAKRQTEATGLGARIGEWVRYRREMLGWDAFKASYPGGASYCYDFSVSAPTPAFQDGTGCPANGEFTNTVVINYVTPTPAGPETLETAVTVVWDEKGQTFSSRQSWQWVRF